MTPDNIRERRLSLEMTQGQAARLVGVDPRTWRYWEAGTKPMPYSAGLVLQAMADVAGFRAWLQQITPDEEGETRT